CLTAASKTRTLARQMSGPVPSPSMNGTIGSSGTTMRPSRREMAVPLVGDLKSYGIALLGQLPDARMRIVTVSVENSVGKDPVYLVVTRQSECFSGLHHSRASA